MIDEQMMLFCIRETQLYEPVCKHMEGVCKPSNPHASQYKYQYDSTDTQEEDDDDEEQGQEQESLGRTLNPLRSLAALYSVGWTPCIYTMSNQQSMTFLENEAFRVDQIVKQLSRQVCNLAQPISLSSEIISAPSSDDLSSEAFSKRAQHIENLLAKVTEKVNVLQSKFEKREISRLEKENAALRTQIATAKAKLNQGKLSKGEHIIPLPSQAMQLSSKSTPGMEHQDPSAPPPQPETSTQSSELKQSKKAKAAKATNDQKKQKSKDTGNPNPPDVSRVDFRVGRIIEATMHPDADSLYVESIDIGEPEPRTILSGLAKFVPLQDMQGRMVVICCNLKPRKMRGIASHGMVMCAKLGDIIEPLCPPEGAVPGDVVDFAQHPRNPDPELNPKKKIFEAVQPHLFTDENGVAHYKGDHFMVEGKGVCFAKIAKSGTVS
eukprot:gene6318-7481_t